MQLPEASNNDDGLSICGQRAQAQVVVFLVVQGGEPLLLLFKHIFHSGDPFRDDAPPLCCRLEVKTLYAKLLECLELDQRELLRVRAVEVERLSQGDMWIGNGA